MKKNKMLVAIISGILVFLISNYSFDLFAQENSKKTVYTESAPKPIGPYSQAVVSGNFVFVSGQIALDMKTNQIINNDIKKETEMIMENIKNILDKSGTKLENIVKTTIYLIDIRLFTEMNEVYAKYFSGNFPARETVQVVALPKGARIEISVIATR